MNKKSILLVLPFLLASITSESLGESFWEWFSLDHTANAKYQRITQDELLEMKDGLHESAKRAELSRRKVMDLCIELEAKRKQMFDEYIGSKIAEDKSYDNLIQEIKENKGNQAVVALLVFGLAYRSNQDIEQQSQDEKKQELAVRFFKDLNTLALIMQTQGNKNSEDMTKEESDKNVKSLLCQRLFGDKTEDQVIEELKQERSGLKQTIIFGLFKNCDCTQDNWRDYAAKHNIEIKED